MIPEPEYDNAGASQCAPINIGKKEEARSFLLILSYVQRGKDRGESMTVARVNINPDVLLWAIEYSQRGMDAFKNKFSHVEDWLKGNSQPTVKQLEDVAKFAYIPFGYLMLSAPPNISVEKIADFRTLNNHGFSTTGEYSAALRDTINIIRRRQEWLRDYKKDNAYAPVDFIGSINRNMSDDEIVGHITKVLKIPVDWRSNFHNKESTLRFFVDMVENSGISVFINGIVGNNTKRKLDVDEFRGFALVDKIAPVIFINGADATAARIFTLFHEVVHLFLGQDGLDDRSEPFCNRIAARLLVPKALFNKAWEDNPHDYDELEKYFKVSQLVLYRAALTYEKINEEEYADLLRQYQAKYSKLAKSSGGGDFYKISPYRAGRGFCRYVNEAVNNGGLSYTEAYQLIGVKGNTFANVMSMAKEG